MLKQNQELIWLSFLPFFFPSFSKFSCKLNYQDYKNVYFLHLLFNFPSFSFLYFLLFFSLSHFVFYTKSLLTYQGFTFDWLNWLFFVSYFLLTLSLSWKCLMFVLLPTRQDFYTRLFYSGGWKSCTQAKTHVLQDDASHRTTRCNMNSASLC